MPESLSLPNRSAEPRSGSSISRLDKITPQPLAAARQLRDALASAAIDYVHWKSNSHLAEAVAGLTDLDLFVGPQDKGAFAQVAEAAGAMRIRSQPWARYPDIEDWLLLDQDTGRFLHLHVHYMLLTGLKRVKHLRLPWQEILLAHLRTDPASGWPIPTAEMELLTLLVRIWAKMPLWRRIFSPKVPQHIRDELRWLLQGAEPAAVTDIADELKLQLEARTLQALFARPGEEKAIITLSRDLYRQMRPHYRMSWGHALLSASALNGRALLSRLLLRVRALVQHGKTLPTGGAMIALIGADGSGKSTLCRDLTKWLQFKLDAHQLYMGSGDGAGGWVHAMRRWVKARLRSKKAGEPAPMVVASQEQASQLERLYRLLDLHLMRRKVRMLQAGRRMARKGSIILLDRYPQNQVDGMSDGQRLQNGKGFGWAAAAERKLYQEASWLGPDLLIRLRIDPRIAQARKPDHAIETIARKCKILEALEFPKSKTVDIDANRPYERVLFDAKQAVWQFLTKQSA